MYRRDNRRLKNACFSLFTAAAAIFAATAAFSIALFILFGALPAIKDTGIAGFFGSNWQPQSGSFGIRYMLLSSLAAAFSSSLTATLISAFAAAWLNNFSPDALKSALERLCAVIGSVPSVIFGLWGLVTVIPLLQKLFPNRTAQSGGASFLAAVMVLTVIQLPMLLPDCIAAVNHAKSRFDAVSCSLGAQKLQTVFFSQLFHARRAIANSFLAGIRLAFCETMAVQLVSGNIVSLPELFGSVRLLGAGLMLEMGYAHGLHRSALFFIGLVMLAAALLTEAFSTKNKRGR